MSDAKQPEKIVPPYASYKTFHNYLDSLRENGIPGRLDPSVMKTLSGQAQSQIRGTLRYFNLIDEDNVPQESLESLVRAQGEEWKQQLRVILERSYSFLLGDEAGSFDLTKATPSQFTVKFKEMNLNGDTVRKAETFFINAANDAGIVISPHIKSAGRSSSETSKTPRPRNGQKPKKNIAERQNSGDTRQAASQNEGEKKLGLRETLLQSLVTKFPDFNPEWSNEAQDKWLTTFDTLADRLMKITETPSAQDENEEGQGS